MSSDITPAPQESSTALVLPKTAYDWLKFLALIVLPGLGALYFGVAQIWGLPNAEEVVGTLVVFDTFLGLVLKASARQYYSSPESVDGYLNANGVDPDTGHPNLQMTVTKMPEDLLSNNSVRLKVGPPPTSD